MTNRKLIKRLAHALSFITLSSWLRSEKDLWDSLGLGDLWGPSRPEKESPKS